MREVHFISQVEVEKLTLVAGAAMLSITDQGKPEVALGDCGLCIETAFMMAGTARAPSAP